MFTTSASTYRRGSSKQRRSDVDSVTGLPRPLIERLWRRHKAALMNLALLAILLVYMTAGALAFYAMERTMDDKRKQAHKQAVIDCLRAQIDATEDPDPDDPQPDETWMHRLSADMYEECVAWQHAPPYNWTLARSFVYGFSTFTTIGCSNMSPQTAFGFVMFVASSCVGLPATILVLANIGQFLRDVIYGTQIRITARLRRWLLGAVWPYLTEQRRDDLRQRYDGFDPIVDRERRKHRRLCRMNWANDEHFDQSMRVKPAELEEALQEDEEEIDPRNITGLDVSLWIATYLLLGTLLLTVCSEKHSFIESAYVIFNVVTSDLGAMNQMPPLLIAAILVYIALGISLTTIAIEVGSQSVRELHAIGKPGVTPSESKNSRIWIGGEQTNVLTLVRSMGNQMKIEPQRIANLDYGELASQAIIAFENEQAGISDSPIPTHQRSTPVIPPTELMFESEQAPSSRWHVVEVFDEQHELPNVHQHMFHSDIAPPDPNKIVRFLTFRPRETANLSELRNRGNFIATIECSPRSGAAGQTSYETLRAQLDEYTEELWNRPPISRAVSHTSLRVPPVDDQMQVYRVRSITSLSTKIAGDLDSPGLLDGLTRFVPVMKRPTNEPKRWSHLQHDFVTKSTTGLRLVENGRSLLYRRRIEWPLQTAHEHAKTIAYGQERPSERQVSELTIPISDHEIKYRPADITVAEARYIREMPSYSALIMIEKTRLEKPVKPVKVKRVKSKAEPTVNAKTFAGKHGLVKVTTKGDKKKAREALFKLYQAEWEKKKTGGGNGDVASALKQSSSLSVDEQKAKTMRRKSSDPHEE